MFFCLFFHVLILYSIHYRKKWVLSCMIWWVHHNGQQSHIKNIDPDRYSHMELVADSCEVALTNVSARIDLALEFYCFLPGSSVRMDIQNDKDLMAVFELYGGSRQIHLYLMLSKLPIPLNQYLLMSMLVMTLLVMSIGLKYQKIMSMVVAVGLEKRLTLVLAV